MSTLTEHPNYNFDECGIYISAVGLQKARSIFEEFTAANGQVSSRVAADAERAVMGNWENFDDLYLGIYAINLGQRKEVRTPVHLLMDHPNYQPHSVLTIGLDMKLRKVSAYSTFDRSLLDESKVAQLQRIRGSLRDLVRYPMDIQAFGIIPFQLKFTIYATHVKEPVTSLPLLSNKDLKSSRGWGMLARRFPITATNIHPIL